MCLQAEPGGDGRVVPFGFGIAQKRNQAAAVDVFSGGQTAEVEDGGIHILEGDHALAGGAGLGSPG